MSTFTTAPNRPSRRLGRRLAGVAGAAAMCAALVAAPTPAAAAPSASRIDLTVAETLAVTTGTVISDTGLAGPGCDGAVVLTSGVTITTAGDRTTFAGTKSIACGLGTLTLAFRASVRDCSTTDSGTWRVTGGTGEFDGARGRGRLVGTYFGGSGPDAGTNCNSDGINDRYTGVLVLP